MLGLINAERAKAGLNLVALGDNAAAQMHAESALENCFSSHWDIDGLKPYMRYTLAGGYQSNGENMLGSSYCITESDGYGTIDSIVQRIREVGEDIIDAVTNTHRRSGIEQRNQEAMEGLMDSPGHRRSILDPWHRKVNIGLAWDRYNFVVVQHFEGDYVEYDHLPAIEDGILTMSGRVKNGVRFDEGQDLGVLVYYDPPPHPLTRGQVSRTYLLRLGT